MPKIPSLSRDLLLLFIGWITTAILFYAYVYLTKGKLENVYLAWDGPSYVIAGLSEYVPARAVPLNSIRSVAITPEFTFLPAHFPLYPTLIRVFSFIGPYRAMIILTLLGHLSFVLSFYFLARTLKLKKPLLLASTLLILPPRYFIVSHTGSSEPIFLTFVTLSLNAYFSSRPYSSGIWAAFALATRPHAALLGLGYLILALYDLIRSRSLKTVLRRYLIYLLLPLTFLGICYYYQQQTGDFFAFFRAISIFQHFSPSLFPTFHYGAPNIESFWHEGSVLYYLIYGYAITKLFWQRQYKLALLTLVFYLPLLFLQHTDISRYALSLLPMTIVAFHTLLSRTDFFLTSLSLLPATIMYGADFIQHNRSP